jgi:hypothetical protein
VVNLFDIFSLVLTITTALLPLFRDVIIRKELAPTHDFFKRITGWGWLTLFIGVLAVTCLYWKDRAQDAENTEIRRQSVQQHKDDQKHFDNQLAKAQDHFDQQLKEARDSILESLLRSNTPVQRHATSEVMHVIHSALSNFKKTVNPAFTPDSNLLLCADMEDMESNIFANEVKFQLSKEGYKRVSLNPTKYPRPVTSDIGIWQDNDKNPMIFIYPLKLILRNEKPPR